MTWHDSQWLMHKRSRWISRSGQVRNILQAGRLGSRKFGGQPQPRWEEDIDLAQSLSKDREFISFDSARLSISTRIREAQRFLTQLFVGDP